jgi:hypothetical protein
VAVVPDDPLPVSTQVTSPIDRPHDPALAVLASSVPALALVDAHRQAMSIASSISVAAAVRDLASAAVLRWLVVHWLAARRLSFCMTILAASTVADRAAASVPVPAISQAPFQQLVRALAVVVNRSVRATMFDQAKAAVANSSDRETTLVRLDQGRAAKVAGRVVLVRAVTAIGRADRGKVVMIVRRARVRAAVVSSDPATGRIVPIDREIDRTDRAKAAVASVGPAIGRTGFRTGTSGAAGGTTIIAMCGMTGTTIGTTTGTTAITGSTTTGGITTTGTTRTIPISITGAWRRGQQ